jgi:hypothetical protein
MTIVKHFVPANRARINVISQPNFKGALGGTAKIKNGAPVKFLLDICQLNTSVGQSGDFHQREVAFMRIGSVAIANVGPTANNLDPHRVI